MENNRLNFVISKSCSWWLSIAILKYQRWSEPRFVFKKHAIQGRRSWGEELMRIKLGATCYKRNRQVDPTGALSVGLDLFFLQGDWGNIVFRSTQRVDPLLFLAHGHCPSPCFAVWAKKKCHWENKAEQLHDCLHMGQHCAVTVPLSRDIETCFIFQSYVLSMFLFGSRLRSLQMTPRDSDLAHVEIPTRWCPPS